MLINDALIPYNKIFDLKNPFLLHWRSVQGGRMKEWAWSNHTDAMVTTLEIRTKDQNTTPFPYSYGVCEQVLWDGTYNLSFFKCISQTYTRMLENY